METELPVELRLLGDLHLLLGGQPVPLPQSRKTRALLVYLALAARPVARAELCELLWENNDDPRAALRWSLSKLKALIDPDLACLLTIDRDTVGLNTAQVSVDALRVQSLLDAGTDEATTEELVELESRFAGTCFAGLEDAGGPVFSLWLESTRAALNEMHGRLVESLLRREGLTPRQRLTMAGRRVALAPYNDAANVMYLRELVAQEGVRSGRGALAVMRESYRRERQADSALLDAWRELSGPTHRGAANNGTGLSGGGPVERVEAEAAEPLLLPEKPSLAVLNFTSLGGHADDGILSQGLTADLNSRLARLSHFFVIARASSAILARHQLGAPDIARHLGVRYLITGTSQRSNQRVRVTVTLIDAIAGSELWSEHYDRRVDDLFSVQDDIVGAVIAAIEPAIEMAEAHRSLLKPPENLNAWEYFHRGLWHCYHFVPGENEKAGELFRKAIELDPYFSRAYAGLSFSHYSRAFLNSAGDVGDVDDAVAQAIETGQQAIALDARDSMAHWSLGRAQFLNRQHDHALASIEQALNINPNYAQGHYARGFVGIHAGADEQSLPYLDSARRLSPFDPLIFAMTASRAVSLATQGKVDEAVAWALRATQQPNAHFHIYAIAAACLQLCGRTEEARNNAGYVLKRHPGFSIDVFRRSFPHRHEQQRQHFIDAMRKAGIPG